MPGRVIDTSSRIDSPTGYAIAHGVTLATRWTRLAVFRTSMFDASLSVLPGCAPSTLFHCVPPLSGGLSSHFVRLTRSPFRRGLEPFPAGARSPSHTSSTNRFPLSRVPCGHAVPRVPMFSLCPAPFVQMPRWLTTRHPQSAARCARQVGTDLGFTSGRSPSRRPGWPVLPGSHRPPGVLWLTAPRCHHVGPFPGVAPLALL